MPEVDDEIAIGQPVGTSEGWDDEDIAALALISVADVAAAGLLWDRSVSRRWRGLLDALAVADARAASVAGETLPPLWFDVRTQRYGSGVRAIQQPAIVAALEEFRTAAIRQAGAAAASLFGMSLDIDLWQRELAAFLKTVAIAAVALGVGGLGRLTADDLQAATQGLLFPLQRLERFARQMQRGVVTAVQATRRASLYPDAVITGDAAGGGYDGGRRRSHIAAGFTLERNVLDPDADHCQPLPGNDTPDCPSVTDRGWRPIGTLPPIGARLCKWNCRCHWEFARDED